MDRMSRDGFAFLKFQVAYRLVKLVIVLLIRTLISKSTQIGIVTSAEASVGKNSSTGIWCDPKGQCYCPEDPVMARYSDPADPSCETYYLCHLGNAFLSKCDARKAFHPEKLECMPRSRIPLHNCPIAVDCDKNGYIKDSQDCTMYYMCFYRQAYHYGCKVNHYYDPQKQICIMDKAQVQNCSKNKTRKRPKGPSKEKRNDAMPSPTVTPAPIKSSTVAPILISKEEAKLVNGASLKAGLNNPNL